MGQNVTLSCKPVSEPIFLKKAYTMNFPWKQEYKRTRSHKPIFIFVRTLPNYKRLTAEGDIWSTVEHIY